MKQSIVPKLSLRQRITVYKVAIAVVLAVFVFRLGYLQIYRHEYYQKLADASQLKQYEIPAERGSIYAYDGDEVVPVVLNETRYRIVADPQIIADRKETAATLAEILKLDAQTIQAQLEKTDSRYEIIANKQTKEIKDAIDQKKLPGIFTNEKVPQRVYIQGAIAGQVLGFVNDAGEGNYGIEQFFNDELTGTPGRVKALTDQNNVPLLASGENLSIDPIDGKDIVLTLDVIMQRQVETILADALKQVLSDSGSIIVLDAQSGAIKALANYPSYDPAQFRSVEDQALFSNAAVSSPLEPGSIMKVLTAAAALDSGSVRGDQTYFDPSRYTVDGYTISNIEESGGAGTRSVADILRLSLNTGATWLLMQMGGGELNEKGRVTWHDYMTNHYHFGTATGVEQGFEADGIVPDPIEGFGLNVKFANTSFGQGMTVTPLQMAAAVASVVNGGSYYKPTLIQGHLGTDGALVADPVKPLKNGVVSPAASDQVRAYMNNVVANNNRPANRDGYQVGGKTGTAQIANPAGGYYSDRFNGTYVGYVGGDTPEYVVVIRVNEPKAGGYAGAKAAPIFARISNMLIDNFNVSRKTTR